MEILEACKQLLLGFDSKKYWIQRYRTGGNSGNGSYGPFANWKAQALNNFVEEYKVHSVLELGCGDGNQLKELRIDKYTGLDPSPEAISRCLEIHASDRSKSFFTIDPDTFHNNQALVADLAISMEVILHLTEDSRYEKYMKDLFGLASKYVGIFNVATDINPKKMAKHNQFRDHTTFVSENFPEWELVSLKVPNAEVGFYAGTGFFFYRNTLHENTGS